MTTDCQAQKIDFLDYALSHKFGDLHFKVDPESGMKAIIAIHNTKLGPALGGCRFIEYIDTNAAIMDAMRLARGMSYKSALANLPLGGGKSVIIKPRVNYDRAAYFHAFGRFIKELNGRYITALDSGTELTDMDIIATHTPFVSGLSINNGNPSPYTAAGVVHGIAAAVLFKTGKDSLHGLHMTIQGLGHVGLEIARLLHEQGVILTVADPLPALVDTCVKKFNATSVATTNIHKVPCDVFVPCALGGVINDQSIKELQTNIIAGAANNQLEHTYHGDVLHKAGILYAPDYVINSGGLIFAASEYFKTPLTEIPQKLKGIHTALLQIFTKSAQDNKACSDIADTLAQEKIQ